MGALRNLAKVSICAGLFGVLGPLAPHHAQAASEEDKAGARAAATQGETAFNAKRWADAVDLFSRAESLVHSPVHLLFKARALVQLGQLVKAHETYLEIMRDPGSSPALTKAQDASKTEVAALEPRLASVTVKLDGPGAADATVTMDGVKVPPALVGLARPVDPGEHKFQAVGNGFQSDPASVVVKEGGTGNVTLMLKPVAGAGAAPVPVPPLAGDTPAAAAGTAGSADTGAAPKSGNGLRTGSYIAFGVGAVGLAVGTVFALSAKSKYGDANDLCKTDPCNLTQAQADHRTQLGKDGDSAKTLSLVGFIAGGVGVAAGTTLFILSNKKTESAQAEVHPWIGLGSLGLSGKF